MQTMLTQIDFQVLDWIADHLRCGFLDHLMPLITYLGEYGILWILLALVLLCRKCTRRDGVAVAVALLLEVLLCTCILKPLVARDRPCWVREDVELLIRVSRDHSFPSGHAAASFAAAGALLFRKARGRIPALVLAIAIGFSRLYLYVHFPSDVLAGALLGLLCGFLGCWTAKLLPLDSKKNIE
jgi:undecaprenyl-diphosphatase